MGSAEPLTWEVRSALPGERRRPRISFVGQVAHGSSRTPPQDYGRTCHSGPRVDRRSMSGTHLDARLEPVLAHGDDLRGRTCNNAARVGQCVVSGTHRAARLEAALAHGRDLRGVGVAPQVGTCWSNSRSTLNARPCAWCHRALASLRISSTTCLPLTARGRAVLAANHCATTGSRAISRNAAK